MPFLFQHYTASSARMLTIWLDYNGCSKAATKMASRTILGSICSRYVTLQPLAKILTTVPCKMGPSTSSLILSLCNFLYVDDFLSFLEWMNSRKILCNEIHSLQFSSQFQFPPVASDQLRCSIPLQGHWTTIPSKRRPILCKSICKTSDNNSIHEKANNVQVKRQSE